MVSKGWTRQKVGELFDVQLGKMLNQEAKMQHPQFPYLTNFNVQWGKFYMDEMNEMHFTEKQREKFSLKHGDVIMCEGGEVGRCAIWNEQLSTCYYQKALHRLRTKGNILPEYFQYYMESLAGKKLLDDYTTRTSISHLTREKLVKLPVNLPPVSEQKKIAKILSVWDQAISTTEKLLDNCQQQKKALVQILLKSQIRFPEFEDEWKRYRLKQVCDFKKGYGLSKDLISSNGKYKCILYGQLYTKYGEVIKNIVSRTNSEEGTKSVAGDILIPSSTTTTGIDLANAVALLEDDVLLGGDINILRPNRNLVCSIFIAHLLTHIKKHQIASFAQGVTIIHLYGNDLKHLNIELPKLEEQQKIAQVLTAADREIQTLQQKLACLKQEKKALMQQLLTGKRRVKVDES